MYLYLDYVSLIVVYFQMLMITTSRVVVGRILMCSRKMIMRMDSLNFTLVQRMCSTIIMKMQKKYLMWMNKLLNNLKMIIRIICLDTKILSFLKMMMYDLTVCIRIIKITSIVYATSKLGYINRCTIKYTVKKILKNPYKMLIKKHTKFTINQIIEYPEKLINCFVCYSDFLQWKWKNKYYIATHLLHIKYQKNRKTDLIVNIMS